MPSLVLRPHVAQDPIKRYKWALLGLVLIAGGGGIGVSLWRNQGFGSPGDSQLTSSEQSLQSLESAAMSAAEAPGNPIPTDAAGGAYAHARKDITNPESMLYQPMGGSSAPGEPISAGQAAAHKDGAAGSSLAQALSRIADAGKKPNKGWGGEAPRTGFAPPKANFGTLGGLSSGGGGSSSVYSSVPAAIVGGGNSTGGSGVSIGMGASVDANHPAIKEGHNQTLNYLKRAEALATQSANATKADLASGLASRSFDGSTAKPTMTAAGAAGGLTDNAVPDNLKANDPNLSEKKLTPPPPPKPSTLKTPQEIAQEEQIKMEEMLIQTAIGGLLGPIFGGLGEGIAGAFGMSAASTAMNQTLTGSDGQQYTYNSINHNLQKKF